MNRAPIIDEAFELDYLRHQIEIDRDSIRAHHRLDFQRHACVPRLERSRRGRCYGKGAVAIAIDRCGAAHRFARGKSLRNLRRLKLRGVTKFADDFDYRALAAFRGDPRGRKHIDSLFLVQGPDHDLELRIRKHAAQSENSCRNTGRPRRAAEQRINRVPADRESAAPVSASQRKFPDRIAPRRNEWIITGSKRRRIGRRAAAAKDVRRSRDIKLSKQPVEAELLQIALVDLDKFRFDLDLLRARHVGLLHDRVDQFQIIRRVAHDEPAALRKKIRARSGHRKGNTLALEKFLGAFAIHQQPATGRFLGVLCRARSLRRRPASSRRLVQRGPARIQ